MAATKNPPRPKNNVSGVVGFSVRTRGGGPLLMVSGTDCNGRRATNEFSIGAHGLVGAAQLAADCRYQLRPVYVTRFADQSPVPKPAEIARRLRRAYPSLLKGY